MKKVSFTAGRPSQQPVARDVDSFIASREFTGPEPMKRFTIDVPISLHKRIKSQCAIEEIPMADEIRKLLEARFPPRELSS
jgi:hypothetical protein